MTPSLDNSLGYRKHLPTLQPVIAVRIPAGQGMFQLQTPLQAVVCPQARDSGGSLETMETMMNL